MPREIDTGAALRARIIGVQTSERRLGRHGERNFKMGQQDIVSDSRHGDDENKYRTLSQSAACGRMRKARLNSDLERLGERAVQFRRFARRCRRPVLRLASRGSIAQEIDGLQSRALHPRIAFDRGLELAGVIDE